MRKINASKISNVIEKLFIKVNHELNEDVSGALINSVEKENIDSAKDVLNILIENAKIAKEEKIPLCQDTGLAVVFMEVGQDVHVIGMDIKKAIDQGIRKAVKKGYLRASVVKNPISRINTKDNTPAIVHIDIAKGNKIKISLLAKGGGAENMSALKMLKPSDGIEGIKQFVIETVKSAGPNQCPPIIVGVGIGGNFETSAYLAKKSLLRQIGSGNTDKGISKLEKELLSEINDLNIGPSGLGGKTTCLAVNIETYPCHIASLPVAVNIECHAHRHGMIVI